MQGKPSLLVTFREYSVLLQYKPFCKPQTANVAGYIVPQLNLIIKIMWEVPKTFSDGEAGSQPQKRNAVLKEMCFCANKKHITHPQHSHKKRERKSYSCKIMSNSGKIFWKFLLNNHIVISIILNTILGLASWFWLGSRTCHPR